MNTHRRSATIFLLMIIITVGSPLLSAKELDVNWNRTEATFSPGPRDKKVHGQFTFTNTGDAPVTIEKIKAPCGCTDVETDKDENEDEEYAPGEKGHINFTLHFTPESGQIKKHIYVTLSDGNTTNTVKLDAVVDAPPYVRVRPQFMSWRQNEDKPEDQTATITVLADTPIHLVDMDSKGSRDAFSVQQKTLEEGRKYEVSVRPRDMSERNNLTLTLYTDYPTENDPLTYKLSASTTPSLHADDNEPQTGFLHSISVACKRHQTPLVVGLSILAGSSIALLVFAFRGGNDQHDPSGHEENG
ncbi:MAG: DUF1573 domain-containing protein [Planctomycetota bacterium]